jgi:sRNA-binding regulator protein Hfq
MVNRKLIRPNLAEVKERFSARQTESSQGAAHGHRESRGNGSGGQAGSAPGGRRRVAPPEQTNAEAFYYLKQMNSATPMVIVLDDGEQLRGHIEWYDRSCLKVHREDAPNILVFKHCIRYLYKQEEEEEVKGAEAGAS